MNVRGLTAVAPGGTPALVRVYLLALVVAAGCGSGSVTGDGGSDGSAAIVDAGSRDAATFDLAIPPADRLGANVEPGGVVFRLWAPHATAATVTGSFAASPATMTSVAGGLFEAHVGGAKPGDRYGFSLTTAKGTLSRTDPYCRQLQGTTCVIVDPSTYVWKSAFTRPAANAMVVYELHVGSYTTDTSGNGTFSSLTKVLATLADLGVNAIELMPVQSFGGGNAGWGYDPQLFLAPKASYGSSDDFRALVDAAHQLGIAIFVDTVVNHTDGWSQAPLHCFDAACNGDNGIYFFPAGAYATTPWGPRPNYPDPHVAAMLLGGISTLVDEIHVDGFRWDSVANIRALDGSGTTPGGRELLVAANALVRAAGGFSIAEDLKGYGAITEPSSTGGFGFDAQWDGFNFTVDPVLTKTNDADRDLGALVGALAGSFSRVIYTDDHDTVGNGGARLPALIDPQTPTSKAARQRSILGAVLLLTSPGIPMLFEGQEFLATSGFTDPPAALPAPTADGQLVRAFYKDMIHLRRNQDHNTGGLGDDNIEIVHRNDVAKVLAYRRWGASGQDVLVAVNLSNKAYPEYDVGAADQTPWTIRLDTSNTAYGADFAGAQSGSITARAGSKDGKPFTLPLVLPAYSAVILSH